MRFSDGGSSEPQTIILTSGNMALTTQARGIYVGGAGNIKLGFSNGANITFVAVPVGTTLEVRPTMVYATGTTATNLVALL